MATVTLRHTWPDGSITEASVEVRESYPDALSEAKRTAVVALQEAIATFDEGDE